MLSKKQYYGMLVVSIIVFVVVFTATYLYTHYTSDENIRQPKKVVSKQSVDTLQHVEMTPSIQATPNENETIVINPSTKIVVDFMNEQDELIKSEALESSALLGYTREDLEDHFKDYTIREFTDKKVVLEKHIEGQATQSHYKIGCQGDGVGVVEIDGTQRQFIPIGISLEDFSVQTGELLKSEILEITTNQKQMLEKDPYYIEQILQSYNE